MDAGLATNLQAAEAYLKRFKAAPLGHFIDGRAVADTGDVFDNVSPVDGKVGTLDMGGEPATDDFLVETVAFDTSFDHSAETKSAVGSILMAF